MRLRRTWCVECRSEQHPGAAAAEDGHARDADVVRATKEGRAVIESEGAAEALTVRV